MMWDQTMPITELDPAIARSYLSNVNVARLVMVHWDDGKRHDPMANAPYLDCKTENASNGYISEECLQAFDERIKWMQENDIWSIITLRGQIAAGGNYPNESDIFHNSTLKQQFISMWKYLAHRYKNTDKIVAFEIMSEPRTDTPLMNVRNMYEETCNAIQSVDPSMLCSIGPAEYYDLCNLNATMLLSNNQTIYNFNFFIPKAYVTANADYAITWPGNIKCCDLVKTCLPGWCPKNACNEYVKVDKEWLKEAMLIAIDGFRNKYNKPVFVDQWGVQYNSPDRLKYDDDALDLMNEYGLSWTNWQWRGWELDTYGMEHNFSNGSSFLDIEQIQEFQKFV